jgi:hypothetical protein
MTLQRITSYLLLAAAALVFVYSLGIMTDLYDSLYYISSIKETSKNYVEGSMIYHEMQPFNRQLTAAGIVLILSALSLFVFRTHDRRKYYIANYITIGINALLNIAVSVWALINVFAYKAQFLTIDFELLFKVAKIYKRNATDSTFWFDISTVVFGILLFVTLLSLGNLVFKIIVMRAERKLIEEGKEA